MKKSVEDSQDMNAINEVTEKPKKRHKHIILKIFGFIIGIIVAIALCVYFFVLQYPNLKSNPQEGKWYRVTNSEMVTSTGDQYRAFFKKGSENKVLICFAGGGASFNEETAKDTSFYFADELPLDFAANLIMNMGGLATASEQNPFSDWTVILVPYATGDWHCGTADFPYTDNDGNDKILYHHGYINYTNVMNEIFAKTDIGDADAVIVTGYSAGGFGAELLADDIFTNYFPDAASKTVLVDGSYLINDSWHEYAADVWKAPESISEKLTSDNITLDLLTSLRNKYGDGINLLFSSSTRDGELARYQVYLDGGKLEDTSNLSDPDGLGDMYQEMLKPFAAQLEGIGVSYFFWDGVSFYGQDNSLTQHTIIAGPEAFQELSGTGKSIAQWLSDAVDGNCQSYGAELLDKDYH